jgi:hypothetical protein
LAPHIIPATRAKGRTRSADLPMRTETNRTVDLVPALAESEKLISGSEILFCSATKAATGEPRS